jgi:hypothetical protein
MSNSANFQLEKLEKRIKLLEEQMLECVDRTYFNIVYGIFEDKLKSLENKIEHLKEGGAKND